MSGRSESVSTAGRSMVDWWGPLLFSVYCIGYAAFVAVAAFATFAGGVPVGGLASEAVAGVPWGIVAGFGLIIGAFVLAVLYATLARTPLDGAQK